MAATRIELPEQLEAYVQFKVRSGLYGNGAEVIRDALRRMMEADEDALRVTRLREALQLGFDQITHGAGVRWTPDRWEAIEQQARERIRTGRRPKADVCP